jgi:transcriptional regulator with XRE-family HTH domain
LEVFQLGFSERLVDLLRGKGITQKQLAAELGNSETKVTDWKRGKSTPSPDDLIRISQMLDVSIDFLLTGVDVGSLPDSVLDLVRRFDKLDDDGQAWVRAAIIQAEERLAAKSSKD